MRVANLLRLGVFGVFVIGGVVAFVFRDRLSTDAQDTRVGDCIEIPAAGEFSSLQHRPCTEPHDGEVFFEIDYTDQDTLPTTAQFDAFFEQECLASRFQTYTGLSFQQATSIDATYFSPTTDSWPRGDREMVCILVPADGGKISRSYRNG